MSWKGIFFGALIGLLLTRNVWGAVAGAIIGYMLDPGAGGRSAAPNARGLGLQRILSHHL